MTLSDAAKDATPGPWEYDEAWSLIIGPKDQEIAALHAADDPAQKSARERKETVQANAYLISLAPSIPALVEALERIDVWSVAATSRKKDSNLREVNNIARAALAQVKGEK